MPENPPSTRRADGVPDDAQRRFDDLLAHLPAGVVMHDAAGRVVAANRQALALLGRTEYEAQEAPGGDAWAAARELAERAGIVCSPGEFYGPESTGWLRLAAVQPDERIALAAARVEA